MFAKRIKNKDNVFCTIVVIFVLVMLIINLYGMTVISPTMETITQTREVMYDTRAYSISAHVLRDSFYLIDSSFYIPGEDISFYAKGDYDTLHNMEGFISKSSNASYINITMKFEVPENWSKLIIFYEYGFSSGGDINVNGIAPGNVLTTIHYRLTLYNTSGKQHFSHNVPEYFFVVDQDSSYLVKEFYSFTFTRDNASDYGINLGNKTAFILNYYIYNITSVPLNPAYNFSVYLMFGLGYKIFKNESFTVTYKQNPSSEWIPQVNIISSFFLLGAIIIFIKSRKTHNASGSLQKHN